MFFKIFSFWLILTGSFLKLVIFVDPPTAQVARAVDSLHKTGGAAGESRFKGKRVRLEDSHWLGNFSPPWRMTDDKHVFPRLHIYIGALKHLGGFSYLRWLLFVAIYEASNKFLCVILNSLHPKR